MTPTTCEYMGKFLAKANEMPTFASVGAVEKTVKITHVKCDECKCSMFPYILLFIATYIIFCIVSYMTMMCAQ